MLSEYFGNVCSYGGFVKGRALRTIRYPIYPCNDFELPTRLYRVVHDGHPHDGVKARSFGLFKTEHAFFQILAHRHFVWISRHASPFMSATTDWKKVRRLCAFYEARGKTGIRVVLINSQDPSWDPSNSRIWKAQELQRSLKMHSWYRKSYFSYEYLIENEIPGQAITGTVQWENIKDSSLEYRDREDHKYQNYLASQQAKRDERLLRDQNGDWRRKSPASKKRCKGFGVTTKNA